MLLNLVWNMSVGMALAWGPVSTEFDFLWWRPDFKLHISLLIAFLIILYGDAINEEL